jgi:Tfp pilus assembly major pilin PilA
MINSIDPGIQLALGFLIIAFIGFVLSAIGIAMVKSAERKESMPELAADLDKGKTPTFRMYGHYEERNH